MKNHPTDKAFIEQACDIVTRFNLLEKKDKVLAGVSGGSDSVALLLFLLAIKEKFSLEIGVAHLNHMLRGKEADNDAVFVKNLAEKLNLPCFSDKQDVAAFAKKNRLSMEESAREVRYSFLKNTLGKHGYMKIALGHTRDDNAELILMNIMRGSGTKGLTGIPPKREGLIIRPLIEISKLKIVKFLESIDQDFVIDSSNNDDTILRNSIRNYFIPLIEEKYNPKIKESLIRLSTIIKDEDAWMENETNLLFKKSTISQKKNKIELSIDIVNNSHAALQKRVIRKAVKQINGRLKRISLVHVEDVIKLSLSTTSGKSIDLPDQIRVYKNRSSLVFKKEAVPLRKLGKKRGCKKRV